MANEHERAKKVYLDICRFFDSKKWNYDKIDNDLVIAYNISSEDLNLKFLVFTYPDKEIVKFICKVPVTVPDKRMYEFAVATCMVNYRLSYGNFVYDISKGVITFENCLSYLDSQVTCDAIEFLFDFSYFFANKYSGLFYALAKGVMDFEEFYDAIHSD